MKFLKYQIIFHIFFIFTMHTYNPLVAMPGFTAEQLKELEETNKAIEEYIASLSPEEQEEFNKSVEMMTEMFENMSDEEFSQLLGELFSEEPMPQPAVDHNLPVVSVQPIIETPLLTSDQKKKVENIIKVIDDIIRQSNVFFVQINSSIEASNSINKWSKKNKIENWPTDSTTDKVNADIEDFIQKLYKVQQKNEKSSTYKYMNDLIEDENLINNLIELQNSLNTHVPQIEISEFDITSLSAKSKNAIINTLNAYTNSLYVKNIPNQLTAIFVKSEPTDIKIKESKEEAEKIALDTLKRTKTPVSATSAGSAANSRKSYDDYGYNSDYGYNDYGYSGGYGSNYGSYESPYGSYYDNDYNSYNGSMGSNDQGNQSRSSGSSATAGGKTSTSNVTQPSVQKEVVVGEPVKKNPRIKSLISNIRDEMKTIEKIIDDNKLTTIDIHVKNNEEIAPVSADIANSIVSLNKEITAVTEEVIQLERSLKKDNKNTQGYYNTQLKAYLESSRAELKTFDDAITAIDYTKKKKDSITPEKEWAYFAGDDALLEEVKKNEAIGKEKVEDLKKSIKNGERISLLTLQENIQKLNDAFNSLKKNTAQKVEKKIVTEEKVLAPVKPSDQVQEQKSTE